MSTGERLPALAKLSAPRLAGVLPRARLFARLDQCLAGQALWVSGPPGAGKTALIASYLHARQHAALWYRVDREDSDPAVCCHYLQLAVSAAEAPATALLSVPAARHGSDVAAFLRHFLRAFYGVLGDRRCLIIDNAQEALAAGGFRKLLLIALREAPPDVRAIVISRMAPPREFARVLGSGELVVLPPGELQLTEEESIAVQKLALPDGKAERSEAQMRKLHQVTQGWVAGLRLLLQLDEPDAIGATALAGADGTALFDYLATEVFDCQSAAVRDFLLKLAHLPRTTVAMADALCGGAAAARILAKMHRDGLLTAAHGSGPATVYTFHPLLRDFLLQRAQRAFGARTALLERRAAALLAEDGDLNAAARLLIAGRLWPDLQDFVKQHAARLVDRGWHRTLAAWLAALPDEQLASDPWLVYWQGQALAPFDPPTARARFERAYRLFQAQPAGEGTILAWSSVVDLICLEWADWRQLDHWLDEAESLRAGDAMGDPELAVRCTASMFGALHFSRSQDPAVHEWAERLLALVESCPDADRRILLGCNLQLHYTVGVGRKKELDRLMAAIAPPPGSVLTPLARTLLCALNSAYCWRNGQSEQAAAAAHSGGELARQYGLRMWDSFLAAMEVYPALNDGDRRRTRFLLKQLASNLDQRRKMDVAHFHYLACLDKLLAGEGDAALLHIETANALADRYGAPMQHALGRLAQAQAVHALGRMVEAQSLLDDARAIARSMRSSFILYQADLCAAQFALDQGDEQGCAAALQNAFSVAAVEDYLNHNGFFPNVMARLCAFALAHAIVPEFARRLIRQRGLGAPAPDVQGWPWLVKVHCLGRFCVSVDGQPVGEAGSALHKPLELLQALIACGGRQVAIDLLVKSCWPSSECRDGRGAFDANLSRLRRLLGGDDTVLVSGGRVSLNDALCWVDAWACERQLGRARAAFAQPSAEGPARLLARADRLLGLYQGDFLAREPRVAWAEQRRQRLRNALSETLCETGRRLAASGETRAAVGIYRRAIEIDPLVESPYRHLMACLKHLGEHAEALRVYARCRQVLRTHLHAIPAKATEAIRATLDVAPDAGSRLDD